MEKTMHLSERVTWILDVAINKAILLIDDNGGDPTAEAIADLVATDKVSEQLSMTSDIVHEVVRQRAAEWHAAAKTSVS